MKHVTQVGATVAMVLATSLPLPSQPASDIYRDPAGRFTLQAPANWKATRLDEFGVSVSLGGADFTVLVFPKSTAESSFQYVLKQLDQQWTGLNRTLKGSFSLASHPAIYATYTGLNAEKQPYRLRLAATATAEYAYVVVAEAPESDAESFGPAFRAIEQSLSLSRGDSRTQAGGGIPVQWRQAGGCVALMPRDWNIVDIDQRSSAVDTANNARTLFAGWATIGIDAMLAAHYPQYRNPEAVVNGLLNTGVQSVGDSGVERISGPQRFGPYIVRQFESAHFRGFVMYLVLPGTAGPGSFIVTLRSATTEKSRWEADWKVAGTVATSIRCTTALAPPPTGIPPRGGPDDPSGYNVQMGTEWARDPRTGDLFLMDYAKEHIDNGPEGPGYYHRVGNDLHKLETR